MSKVVWQELEAEYVSSDLSYRELAERHGLAKSRVAKVGAENRWVEKRKVYRTNVAQSSLQNARVSNIRKNTNKLNELISAAEKMSGFLNDALDHPDSFYKHILMTSSGKQVIEDTDKLDTRAVRDIVTSISNMTSAVKEMNELINENENDSRGNQIEIIEGNRKWAD